MISRSSLVPLPPGIASRHPLGQLPRIAEDPLAFFLEAAADYGDVVRFRAGPMRAHLLAHPDGVRHVLQENHKAYDKKTRGFDKLRLILGNGLLTSEGDFWLRQRRIAQPAFHKERIAAFGEKMTAAAVDTTARWRKLAESGATLDVAREMMRLTLRIVGETMLSSDVTGDADAVGDALTFVVEDTNHRITELFDVPLGVPTRRNRRFRAALRTLDEVVLRRIVERRKMSPAARPPDLLTMLMEAKDGESGEHMSDAQLRDEVMTIFLAGHETTANALTWSLYCLSKHPTWDRAVRAEVREALGDGAPTLADLPRLKITRMVLSETMRLYPPAWLMARGVTEDDIVGGYRIAKGSIVFLSPWVTHRHPGVWSNPEGFDPERFTTENEASRPRLAYFPFGGGPRLCIGQNFALLEAQLVLAALMQGPHVELPPGADVRPEPLVTLRPHGGLKMKLRSA